MDTHHFQTGPQSLSATQALQVDTHHIQTGPKSVSATEASQMDTHHMRLLQLTAHQGADDAQKLMSRSSSVTFTCQNSPGTFPYSLMIRSSVLVLLHPHRRTARKT